MFGAGGATESQAKGNHQPAPAEALQNVEEGDAGETLEGVASIALLPSGAISGHFIRLPDSICYGLQGTRNPLSHSPYICCWCSSGMEQRLAGIAAGEGGGAVGGRADPNQDPGVHLQILGSFMKICGVI